LFFGFSWTDTYKVPMIILGVLAIATSALSFGVNILACGGITTRMKKSIVYSWIFALIFMLVG
jgi:hypothetical protein